MADSRWYSTNIAIPADLTAAADFFNSIIEYLINLANVALATLEVVKALLIGLLDPIRAIVEAIIAEIEAFLADLRQLGIYMTWDETVFPFVNLVGGFTAYQTRMVGRLTNLSDPTRPNFTSRSATAGVFLYANANPTGIYAVIDLINLILRLFGINRRPRGFPTPVGLSVSYGGADIAAFGNLGRILRGGTTPSEAKVKWTIAAPSTVVGPMPLIPAPPKFLVEVSVFEEGFGIAYNLPTPNSNENRQTFGVVVDPEGTPLRVFGGTTLALEDSLKSTVSGDDHTVPGVGTDNRLKANNVTVYAYRSSADTYPVPLSSFTEPTSDGKYLFQRTFVYDLATLLGINLASPGQPFMFRLKAEDMPYNATISQGADGKVSVTPDDSPASVVYVRVRAVGDGYTADADGTLNTPLYYLDESTFNGTGTVLPAVVKSEGKGFGPVSDPVKVTFPLAGTSDYLDTVTTAILLLVLSRAELRCLLDEPDDISSVLSLDSELAIDALENYPFYSNNLKQTVSSRSAKDVGLCPTGLEALARQIVPLFGLSATGGNVDSKSLFGKEGTNQLTFRRTVYDRCRRLAERFIEKSGVPPADMLTLIESLSEVSGTVKDQYGIKNTVAPTPLRMLTWGQVFPEIAGTITDKTTLADKTILEAFTDPVEYYEDDSSLGGTLVSGVAPNPLSIEKATPSDLRRLFASTWKANEVIEASYEGSVVTDAGATKSYTMTVSETVVTATTELSAAALIQRSPGFLLALFEPGAGAVSADIGVGSSDMSPVVYFGSPPMWKYAYSGGSETLPKVVYVRNGIVRFPALSSAIANVLSYASGSYLVGKPTGAWVAIRLFPQGLPQVDELLQKINDFLQSVLDGLQGIIDIILAYINFIEARIYEFEALLRRIQALLNIILSLDVGLGFSALVVLPSAGTDGLVRDFMSAEDKPESTQDDLGLGFAMVAGGVPLAILELFTLFFPSED